MPSVSRRASSYSYSQEVPSTEWTINHNLGRVPAVTVFIMFGGKLQTVLPFEVESVTPNQVIVRFSAPQSGSARLQ